MEEKFYLIKQDRDRHDSEYQIINEKMYNELVESNFEMIKNRFELLDFNRILICELGKKIIEFKKPTELIVIKH
jgi:hypothetical protein